MRAESWPLPQSAVIRLAQKDIPALITYIEALEARQVKLIEATRAAVAMCLCCDGTGEARTLGDETEVGQSPGSSAIPCPNCTDWRKALAALDSPEELKAMEAGDG